eukprot:760642-Hanusia_phi.AAC.4
MVQGDEQQGCSGKRRVVKGRWGEARRNVGGEARWQEGGRLGGRRGDIEQEEIETEQKSGSGEGETAGEAAGRSRR